MWRGRASDLQKQDKGHDQERKKSLDRSWQEGIKDEEEKMMV